MDEKYDSFLRMVGENDLANSMSINFYSANVQYYKAKGDLAQAEAYCDSMVQYYVENEMNSGLILALNNKLELNHLQRHYDNDFSIAKSILSLTDSLNSFRLTTSLLEMTTLLGMDKLQIETQQLKARHQFMIMMLVIGTLVSLLIIGGVWFAQKRQREREHSQMLSEQNEKLEIEVARQTEELRQKNEDITANINYAKRIQTSMLPNVEVFARGSVEGAFAFFSPCEIVSGDFYWTHKNGSKLTFVCADCTGHGVSGGFLSMIGCTLLTEIYSQNQNLLPGEVLKQLDFELVAALDKRGDVSVQDGMDVALVTIDTEEKTVSFAGARRPMFVVHNGELKEYKGTKRSIGDRDEVSRTLEFETVTFSVEAGDTVYICSDGLADQFGGQTVENQLGKRLKSGGLKRLLLEVSALPITEQNARLSTFFEEWKGSCYQVDDVSLIGVRV